MMIIQIPFLNHLFLSSLVSLVSALVLSPVAILFARWVGLMDIPGKYPHKIHTRPTPLAGGTALAVSLIVPVLAFRLWENEFARLLFPAAAIIYLFGLLDDARGLTALPKLAGQLLASGMLIVSGVSVHFIQSLRLEFMPALAATWLDIGLTLLWLVGITNAMNLIDSMDGLACGLSGIAFLFLIPVTFASGQTDLTEISVIFFGIILGLYFYNVTPARLFLGDSGAQTIGFVLAALALAYVPVGTQPTSSWLVPVFLLGLPIFDTVLVVYARMRKGIPVFQASLDHTYHRLIERGVDKRRAVLVIHLAAIITSLLAFLALYQPPLVANIIFGLILVFAGVGIILLMR